MQGLKYKGCLVVKSNRLISLLNLVKGGFSRGFAGFYFFILTREGLDPRTQKRLHKHELQHILDMKEIGYAKFVWTYLKYNSSVGYTNNPFEIRAREAEQLRSIKLVRNDARIKL